MRDINGDNYGSIMDKSITIIHGNDNKCNVDTSIEKVNILELITPTVRY